MTKKSMEFIKNAEIIDFPDAGHEILMKKDAIRSNFLQLFINFCDTHIS